MKIIEKIIAALNWISDRDSLWWPLLKLRPKKNERYTRKSVFILSSIITIVSHATVILIRIYMGKDIPALSAILVTVGMFVCVVLYQVVFAYCWNYRVSKLVQHDT